jgi:hypothetical protein
LKKKLYTAILFILSLPVSFSQVAENDRYVQVSGIITDDAYNPVPGATILSKKLKKGTLSERSGIYSITSIPGDTIYFRALGYKRYHTIIPQTFEERNVNMDIALELDTIHIKEVNIMPWKNYNEFLKDITKVRPVDPLIENMNDNIASIYVAIAANQAGTHASPEAGYRYSMQQNFNAAATHGQYPINNLLNPFAWSKFFKGLKNGLLENKKYEKPNNAKVRKKIKNPKD